MTGPIIFLIYLISIPILLILSGYFEEKVKLLLGDNYGIYIIFWPFVPIIVPIIIIICGLTLFAQYIPDKLIAFGKYLNVKNKK